MNNKTSNPAIKSGGFTIVELMMATMVFAVILVVITVGVLHFTNAYYRGINSSTVQNTTRGIADIIGQDIQFGGGSYGHAPAVAPYTTYCVGNQKFDFVMAKELPIHTPHALYESAYTPGSACTPGTFSGGKELLGPSMRLSKFSISQLTNGLYTISLRIVYGDDDLLCAPGLNGSAGGCNVTDPFIASPIAQQTMITNNVGTVNCKSQAGSQFCSVSEFTTTVQTRIGG